MVRLFFLGGGGRGGGSTIIIPQKGFRCRAWVQGFRVLGSRGLGFRASCVRGLGI